jgi:ParB family chromosome partitioning protein
MNTVIAQASAPPAAPAVITPTEHKIEQIALGLIVPSKTNPRETYDESALKGLAETIKIHGVLQAIVIRPYNWFARNPKTTLNPTPQEAEAKFEIVAGFRRWMASRLAGKQTVPAVVRNLSDLEVAELQAIENEQREDVQPLEQGRAYRNLIDQLAKDQPKAKREDLVGHVAQKIGKSARHVYARMKLTELIPSLQKDLAAGWISTSHADELVRLCPKDQEQFAAAHLYHVGDDEMVRGDAGPKFANSVRFVKEKISKEYQLDLTKPPFAAEDSSLVPAAGPCSTCINNSINSPLFAGAEKNKPTCMDRACFAKKREAFVAIEAAKQKSVAAKPEMVRVTPLHELPYSRRKEKDQPKTRKEWKTAHKGECAHVQPAVVVDASGLHDQAVGAKLVCANTKCDVHFAAKPKQSKTSPGLVGSRSSSSAPKETETEKKQREKEALQDKADLAGDVAVVKAVVDSVKGLGVAEIGLLIESFGNCFEVDGEGLDLIAEIFGFPKSQRSWDQIQAWWKNHSLKFTAIDAAKFIVAGLIAESVGGNYGNFERDDLDKLAANYKLDADAIRKKAAEAALKPAQTSAKLAPAKGAQVRRAATPDPVVGGKSSNTPSKPLSPPKKSSTKKATKKAASPKKKGGR